MRAPAVCRIAREKNRCSLLSTERWRETEAAAERVSEIVAAGETQADRQTGRQADRQTGRQTEPQVERAFLPGRGLARMRSTAGRSLPGRAVELPPPPAPSPADTHNRESWRGDTRRRREAQTERQAESEADRERGGKGQREADRDAARHRDTARSHLAGRARLHLHLLALAPHTGKGFEALRRLFVGVSVRLCAAERGASQRPSSSSSVCRAVALFASLSLSAPKQQPLPLSLSLSLFLKKTVAKTPGFDPATPAIVDL
eukprot:COSAG03_NODE_3867_length_1785_cov_15.438909_2_plen_260_part_00